MVVAFVFNRPYPAAPFSTLFLFGRGQDVGFQKAIDISPRKRHHVRFWALTLERNDDLEQSGILAERRSSANWRTCALGGGRNGGHRPLLTEFTFQFTHATEDDVNGECDFIIAELKTIGVIGDVVSRRAGETLVARVNHYVTDGDVVVAKLS